MSIETKHERIEDVKRPIKTGEIFSVPCIVKREGKTIHFAPVIGLAHNDKENGQPEKHYHVDYRFIITKESKSNPLGLFVLDDRFGYIWPTDLARFEKGKDGELEYHDLPVINEKHHGETQKLFIRNTNLKHKCIHKGKCPHRGFDLSQEVAVNGIITCPLHGLEFEENTGKITHETLEILNNYRQNEKKLLRELSITDSFLKKINGKTISKNEYEVLGKLDKRIYSSYECPNGADKIDLTYREEHTKEFRPQRITNGKTFNFTVQL